MQVDSTLYVNGTIHTMRSKSEPVDSVLVRSNRIAAIGGRDEIEPMALGVRKVDLDRATVLPGFNDSHAHLLSFGLTLEQLDVTADTVHTIADIVEAVRFRVGQTGRGAWVHGQGYNHNELAEGRHIVRHDLDPVSRNHPVVLDHTSGHVLTCNSVALERAEISRNSSDPQGGEIERDEHGEPTGVLKESAMDLLRRIIPRPTHSESTDAILRAMDVLSTFGITSASDAWTGHDLSIEPELAVYRAALASGRLSGRITLMPLISFVAPQQSDEVRAPVDFDVGSDPEWLRIGPTKIFADGALSTRTAAMREPYADEPNNRGVLLSERTALVSSMRRAHRAGWQIATHALGDRAVEMVLDCYEEVTRGRLRTDHRHRIEHCMYADPGMAQRMRTLGIVLSLQPDIYRLGDAYIGALGLERAGQSIPTGLYRDLGIPMAFSSDLPVIPGPPLDVIRSARERKTPKGIVLGPEHAIPAMEALRAYTWGGAFATHSEHIIGSLTPGMLADLTILSHDPARTSLEDWHEIEVVKTVVGGREVYTK